MADTSVSGQQTQHEGADSAVNMQQDQIPHDSSSTPSSSNPDGRDSINVLLDEAIITRHSSRLYTPKPVPRTILEKALELAAHSPSNSNTQAWRLFVVTGSALKRLTSALTKEASQGTAPNVPGLPDEFRKYRSELGKQVYGEGWQIPRDDAEARKAAVLRNFSFFGAPVGVIVCMSDSLPGRAALSVGMYIQTFLLGLTERGVGSCVEVSVSGYPEVVRREVGIPEDMQVLCGIAIGYEDESAGVNKIRSGRQVAEKTTSWVDE